VSTITPKILLQAYSVGIFPMAETAEDSALYWVEPEERGIIPLRGVRISHSLRKQVRRQTFEVHIDWAFSEVIEACAANTNTRKLRWINSRIRTLYKQLKNWGVWRSVACWGEG
jgi:leucyl/phenylalanyl-tRNA--protein transferase